MTMKQQYDQAKERGELKSLVPTYVEFKKKGDTVLGRLRGISTVTSSSTKQDYNQYLVDTDKGLVKFALGNATDNEVCPSLVKGSLYSFEFIKKEDLGGNRSVNKWNIVEVLESEEPITENPDDEPFEEEVV